MRIAVVLLFVASLAANAQQRIEPSGYYIPTKPVANLQSLEWIELWSKGEALEGALRLKCSSCQKGFENKPLVSIKLSGAHLSLKAKDGTTFEGDFLIGGDLKEVAKDNEVVLRGNLRTRGQDQKVEFGYYVGD